MSENSKTKKSKKSVDARAKTLAVRYMNEFMESLFPFLPGNHITELLLYGSAILVSVRFSPKRIAEILNGASIDENEKELFIWADGLLKAIILADEQVGGPSEIMWLMNAKKIAMLELEEETALEVIDRVRTKLETAHSNNGDENRFGNQ